MTNSVVSRLGQVNATGADDALFLKQFGGEILTEFETASKFKGRNFVRQIRNGKTAQFPLIGTVGSSYHTPGNFIDGQTVNHAELTISVDGLLVAPIFIAKIDELMNHYDVRGPYATEMGRELAKQYDINVARMFVLAARSSSPLTGRAGGSVIDIGATATAAALKAGLFGASQAFDEKNVGSEDRYAWFRPAHYYVLAQDTTLVDRDYSPDNGSYADGVVDTVCGISLVKTNNLPNTNVTTGLTKYQGNFSKTVGIVGNRWAVGTVQLMDIGMDSEWEIRRQGTFMLAKMAVGHGILRADSAIELKTT